MTTEPDLEPLPAMRERGTHPAATAGFILAFVLVLGLALGVVALVYTRSVNESVDQGVDQRDGARITACVAYNVNIVQLRAAIKDSLLALLPPHTTLTAEQQVRIDTYNTTVDARLGFRDCSPAGITAYYEIAPVDPAVDTVTP